MVLHSLLKELEEYLHFVEEAAKRNHRKLGSELELFMFLKRLGNAILFTERTNDS